MKILIVGDFCQEQRVDKAVREKRYGDIFDNVATIIKDADYSIVNFEFPIVLDDAVAKPIIKRGPNLRGSVDAVDAIKYAGFNCCTLANNHILDQGEQCCIDTNIELQKAGIDTVGVGNNLDEAAQIHYRTIQGETLAIINCCEHEFSIATNETAGANPLNPIQQFYKIQEARKNADYVLVIVHGGHELCQLPSPEMQETYRFFIDSGADAVVNHHQHCFSGYELYKEKPIFYGLGNFCFDNENKRNDIWNEGYMVSIDFMKKASPSFEIYPFSQCGDDYFIKQHSATSEFVEKLSDLNTTIATPSLLYDRWTDYEQKHSSQYMRIMHPFNGKMFRILERLNLFSIPKTYFLYLCAVIQCESHRSSLLSFLRSIQKKEL